MRFGTDFAGSHNCGDPSDGRPGALPEKRLDADALAILDPATDAEIEQLVKTPIRFLSTSDLTRRFYHSYRWDGRYRSITYWLLAVAFLNLMCAVGDPFIVSPQHVMLIFVSRVLISLTFATAALPLRSHRSPFVEGLCVLVPCTILLLTTGIVGLAETPLLMERFLVNACFVIASGVVFLRIGAGYMSVLCVLTCIVTTAFVSVSAIQPFMAKAEIILFHVGAMIALWNGQRVQMLYRYRGIILSLHNEVQARKMSELNAILVSMTLTDPLTGIANRRHFDETLARVDPGAEIAILMIDIDHFKRLNDTMGHGEGDRRLRMVAQAIRNEVRAGDTAARYGGEEFAVLALDLEPEDVFDLAERVRAAVAQIDWGPCPDDLSVTTISVGAAQGKGVSREALLKCADHALYEAKDGGRNRVMFPQRAVVTETQLDIFHEAA